ncbi:MAG: glycosyltransferase family 2 protein [Muribaculum sp.]|nr:glycosyltransferase family 2 protein [Muribaculum sp.]
MTVTVVTPTYNRSHLLSRLYDSLCRQTYKDFEWLIVDDGSVDDTNQVINQFQEDRLIEIRYLKKTNGGKHTAINLAAREASGELFFIADSDDWLPENAIKCVVDTYNKIKDCDHIAGICGLDSYADGLLVGDMLPCEEMDESPQNIRCLWGIKGDMKEVFRTSIMKKFPFPEIPGEKFCPEALVWNRIGKYYKLRYINKPIYTVEYQPDGITSSITRARIHNPIATMMAYSEWFDDARTLKVKLKMGLNYWRFRFWSNNKQVKISSWGKLLKPIGFLLFANDYISFEFFSDKFAFLGLNKDNR